MDLNLLFLGLDIWLTRDTITAKGIIHLTRDGTNELTIDAPVEVINQIIEHVKIDDNGFSIKEILSLHEWINPNINPE